MIAHRVGTFFCTTMKPKVYIFPYNKKHLLSTDTTKSQLIEFLVGQYITDAFQANDSITRGLLHVRIKVGSSTIVAQKRINDVKILIYEDKQ